MKKANIVFIILYLLFVVYFSTLNWSLFINEFNINLGFNSVLIPIFPILLFINLIFLLFQWLTFKIIMSRVQKTVDNQEKKLAILKAGKYDGVENQLKEQNEILIDIQGIISELFRKIEDINKGNKDTASHDI